MIVLDNSVLSALTNLDVLDKLMLIFPEVYITQSILEEYSTKWKEIIPKNINIIKIDNEFQNAPLSLSDTDLDVLTLAITNNSLLATDDRNLRKFSKQNNILVTGSLGLIRQMYLSSLFDSDEMYINTISSLSKDVFLSQDLIDWALSII